MAWFMVRVVLHDVEDDSRELYSRLHEKMEEQNFERTITSGDGVTYHLPDAEYFFEGDVTMEWVRSKASETARQIRAKYSVLVTQAERLCWRRLDKVEDAVE